MHTHAPKACSSAWPKSYTQRMRQVFIPARHAFVFLRATPSSSCSAIRGVRTRQTVHRKERVQGSPGRARPRGAGPPAPPPPPAPLLAAAAVAFEMPRPVIRRMNVLLGSDDHAMSPSPTQVAAISLRKLPDFHDVSTQSHLLAQQPSEPRGAAADQHVLARKAADAGASEQGDERAPPRVLPTAQSCVTVAAPYPP